MSLIQEPTEEAALVLANEGLPGGDVVWERDSEGGWYSYEINQFGPSCTWEQVQEMSATLTQVWMVEDFTNLLLQEEWGVSNSGYLFSVRFGSEEEAIQYIQNLGLRQAEPVRRLVGPWEVRSTEE